MNSEDKIEILKRYLTLADEIDTLKACNYDNVRRIERIKDYRNYIMTAILQVKNDKQRIVLQQIYLLGRTRELVAERLNYSVTQINRYHKEAVKCIDLDAIRNFKL